MRKDFEFFKGTYNTLWNIPHGKYHILKEILYNWYGKCTSANIYPNGALLQEEVIEIKKILVKEALNDFTALNGWLESWKKTYGVREKRLCGEANGVSMVAIESWIERLPELC